MGTDTSPNTEKKKNRIVGTPDYLSPEIIEGSDGGTLHPLHNRLHNNNIKGLLRIGGH
jgi:serine/threonine protein kinase